MAVTNQMDSLYNIFQREKERVGDEFTVFYSENRNSMQYKNEVGTLTILFQPEEGSEKMYYRSNDEKNRVGLGELVQTLTENGENSRLTAAFDGIPQEFSELAHSYQFDRDQIGVEKPAQQPKKIKGGYER